MLSIKNLCRPGLSAVNLDIDDGDVVVVTGRSGSGKSLLLRAIADLDPNTGDVILDNEDREMMPARTWRRQVTYVPAESGWWKPHVGENFEAQEIAAGYLVRLGFSADVLGWPVDRLSTGERQRLALLRAMVNGPRVMLLDEPTSALDPEAAAKVEGILHEKLQGGVSMIIVTHDAAQAKRMSSRRMVMADGVLSVAGDVK